MFESTQIFLEKSESRSDFLFFWYQNIHPESRIFELKLVQFAENTPTYLKKIPHLRWLVRLVQLLENRHYASENQRFSKSIWTTQILWIKEVPICYSNISDQMQNHCSNHFRFKILNSPYPREIRIKDCCFRRKWWCLEKWRKIDSIYFGYWVNLTGLDIFKPISN